MKGADHEVKKRDDEALSDSETGDEEQGLPGSVDHVRASEAAAEDGIFALYQRQLDQERNEKGERQRP